MVTHLKIFEFAIPSYSCCFPLRSASGSPLGRILAPSWRHLGPSWDDFSRFLVNFLRFLLNFGVHNGWTVGTTTNGPKRLKITRPGGMREAIRRPGLPGTACWILFCCLFLLSCCLSWSFCPGFPGPGCSCPPPKVLPAGSNIPPGLPDQRSWHAFFSLLFFDLVFYRFFLRFGLHCGSQNRPEIEKKRKKWLFKYDSGFAQVFLQFFREILSFRERPNP